MGRRFNKEVKAFEKGLKPPTHRERVKGGRTRTEDRDQTNTPEGEISRNAGQLLIGNVIPVGAIEEKLKELRHGQREEGYSGDRGRRR